MKKLFLMIVAFYMLSIQAQVPPGFESTLFSSNVHTNPIDLEFHPDENKMVVAERAGVFWLYNLVNDTWVKNDVPMLNISNQVTKWFERGVQSILLDSHYIYVYYTVEESYLFPELELPVGDNSATVNRVSRWEVAWSQNRTVFGEKIIVDGIPSLAGNHQGGGMAFGLDDLGQLYISTGDAASDEVIRNQAVDRGIIPQEHENFDGQYRSQIKSSPNGKILRVLLWNGKGFHTNPYYNANEPSSWMSRLYDYGYRNPFEISFSDSLYVADVGKSDKEEITVAKPDANAGWGKYEGFDDNTWSSSVIDPDTGSPFEVNYTNKPILDYGHNGEPLTRLLGEDNEPFIDGNAIEGNSITGGVVLKEGFGPYTGYYVFSDYTRGWLNMISPNRDFTLNFSPSDTFSNTIDITQAPDGSLYLVTLFGKIYRVHNTETLSTEEFKINDYLDSECTVFNILQQPIYSGKYRDVIRNKNQYLNQVLVIKFDNNFRLSQIFTD